VRTVQKIAKNTGVIIAGNVIFRLVSLFVIIYLARYLGTEGFGKYSFVFAYLAFFNIVTDLGLQQILVRELARNPSAAPKLIGNAYFIRLLLTVSAVGLAIVIITLLQYPDDTTVYVYIASLTLFFISFSDLYTTIFQANLAMEYNVITKLAFKFVSAGLIFWIIFSHGTLLQVMVVIVFSEGVRTLLNYSFSRKFVRPSFTIEFGLWRYLLKECLPLALTSVIVIIYYRIDVIMLSMMNGDVAVGIYSAAYRLCDPFSLIPYALMMPLFPLMSSYFKSSEDKLIKIYTLVIRYILIIALPITIGTVLIADKVILLIYEAPFADSSTVLQILMWAVMFGMVQLVFLNVLVAIDRQKLIALSTAFGAAVNIVLNFILIPVMSYNGAAIATVATSAVLTLSMFYFISKYLRIIPVHKILIKPMIAVLGMGVSIYYLTNLNLLVLIPLAATGYIVTLLGLKVFTTDDWELLKKAISIAK
jgi:O-antigen/teichoic acid export membrane protein